MNKLIHQIQVILNKVVDILLPKESEVSKLESLGVGGLFDSIPRAGEFDFETEKIKAVFSYQNPLCRQAIWEIKYRANQKLIRDFSHILYDFILEELSDLKTLADFQTILLVPVPSSKDSVRAKGFNQCQLIIHELIKIAKERQQNNFLAFDNLLVKKINTSHQSKTHSRQERLENLKNTFTINQAVLEKNNLDLNNNLVVLIDDVITTGATMNESFRALRVAGARKIVGFALAH